MYKPGFRGFPFLFKRGGVEMRPAALCYVPDLGQKVFQLLEQNEKLMYIISMPFCKYEPVS